MDEQGTEGISLGQVIHRDKDLYTEVCQSFVDLYRVAIKVLDDQGNRLLDLPSRADLCQYIFDFAPCRRACVNIVGSIRKTMPDFKTLEKKVCFSGAEYRSVPIHHETDVVGKVVFGPFLPSEVQGPPEHFLAMDPTLDANRAWETTTHFRRMSATLSEKVAKNLATVIEVMAFVGFKGQMTTDMHVESITEAYAELSSKNEALQATVNRLHTVNNQRSNFLARVSSGLKTPLTNIIGYSEMLSEGVWGEVTEDQAEFLKTIMDQGEHMMNVTQTMEELSRIERGQVEIVPDSVHVEELLEQTLPYARKMAEEHDVEVELLPSDPNLPSLWVDDEKVRSVLHHLIGNAVKFTPAGGRVILSAAGPGESYGADNVGHGFVAISVSDNGIGIEQEYHEQMFHPFFTVHSGPDRAYTGTGVGLTIAKAYIDVHGGRILVDSTPGQGSTFTIFLPTEDAEGG